MVLYIPHSIFHLARFLYVRPENFSTLLRMYKTQILYNLKRLLRCYMAWRLQLRHKFDEVLHMQLFAEAVCVLYHTQATSLIWTLVILYIHKNLPNVGVCYSTRRNILENLQLKRNSTWHSSFSPNFTAIKLQKQLDPAGAMHVVGHTWNANDLL